MPKHVQQTANPTGAGQILMSNGSGDGAATWQNPSTLTIAQSQVTGLVSALAAKQATITLTTTGSSGAATLVGATLNIPNYSSSGMANPMTTLGDLIYEDATPTAVRLAGNTTTTRKFLRQTGNGTISAAPAWDTLVAGDIPDISATYLPLTGGTLTGNLTLSTHNIVTDTSTGTKIGTATSQKLGFFNATPVVQQSGDLITALSNLGLVVTGSISEADVTNLTTDLAGKVSTSTNLTVAGNTVSVNGGSVTQDNITGLSSTGLIKRTGANTLAIATADTDYSTPTGTETFTNKRVTPRTGTTASSATPTINSDNVDVYTITALAAAITSMTTNLSGTPTLGQEMLLGFKDNGTARAITWGSSFVSSGVATLLATTVISKQHWVKVMWDGAHWVCMAVDATGY